jgi:hypothetical protein
MNVRINKAKTVSVLIKHHNMRGVGAVEVYLHAFLTSVFNRGIDQLYFPAGVTTEIVLQNLS